MRIWPTWSSLSGQKKSGNLLLLLGEGEEPVPVLLPLLLGAQLPPGNWAWLHTALTSTLGRGRLSRVPRQVRNCLTVRLKHHKWH